tara:strand:- start:13519 stop:14676 length:1158 start_codon:yes stop_codon:yes gene_type:complete
MQRMPVENIYRNTRKATEALCSPLSPEDYVPQLVEYASPPKWHLAHTTWFFEEMILKQQLPDYQVFDPQFGFLFNSYYNTIGERLARSARGDITRPDVESVYQYRDYVDEHMHKLMNTSLSPQVNELIILGINHEQQHQELLLTDLKFALGHNPLFPVYHKDANYLDNANTEEGRIQIDAGLYEVGHEEKGFHFDNECSRHKVYLNSFSIDKALVTNGEYLEFIEAGGYENFQYWLDDGWHWLQQNRIKAPLYWHKLDNTWHYYTLAGLQSVNPDAMLCHVSYYEACAFASYMSKRLPTEFEWEIASQYFLWGKRWEWTNSAYLPYPDYKISAGAVGEYNGKFMINQMVLRGASVATAPQHSRNTYRNFFLPHLQWQYSGIRLAQ